MAKKTIANLNIQLGASSASLRRDLNAATSTVTTFGARVRSALATLTVLFGISSSFGGIGFAAKLAADAETMAVSFRVMLGDGQKAKKLLEDLQKFAAATPFQLPELQDAARKLLAFNEPVENLIESLRSIGDISAGIGAPIGEIAELYGKARVQGRLFQEDINQLTGRGIPIIQELAKQFGVSESAVRDLVSSGRISFANLEAAFKSLTSTGGKFAGLMDAQSKTLAGTWSTLKDSVEALFRTIGTKLLPVFKASVAAAAAVTESIGSLDAGSVKAVFQITVFAASFALFVSVIPKVIAAIRAIIAAYRALTTASVVAQAVTGVGALKVAASLALAAGLAYGAGKVFDKFTEDASEASAAATKAAEDARTAIAQGVKIPEFDAGPSKAELLAQKEAAKELKREFEEWQSIGDRIRESVRTPFEATTAAIEEAREALQRGVIDLETYNRAASKAVDELLEQEKQAQAKRSQFARSASVGAAVRGTAEGFAAVHNGRDALNQLRDSMKRQEALAKRRELILSRIEDLLTRIEQKPAAVAVKTRSI